MKIISKPSSHKLPLKLQKRLQTEHSPGSLQNENGNKKSLSNSHSKSKSKSTKKNGGNLSVNLGLPNIYLKSKGYGHGRSRSTVGRCVNVSYVRGIAMEEFRAQMRRALSLTMTFQNPQKNPTKLLPDTLPKTLKQPLKTLQYNTPTYKKLHENFRELFGNDLQLQPKDLIAAYGEVTGCAYVFFTGSAYYQPYSLCCGVGVYGCVEERERDVGKRYGRRDGVQRVGVSMGEREREEKEKDIVVITKFICSKCEQPLLSIHCKSPKYIEQSRIIGKDTQQLQAERQKISMSIAVASGRFKRMRIDEAVRCGSGASRMSGSGSGGTVSVQGMYGLGSHSRYNLEDMLRERSRTTVLALKTDGSKQII